MDSRQRLLTTLEHREPDRIPYDLGSTQLTGITHRALVNLQDYLGHETEEPVWSDVIQQLALPMERLMQEFRVDTRGLFPLTSHNWDVYEQVTEDGDNLVYRDEWGMTHHMPKEDGYWFSVVAHPLADCEPSPESVAQHSWPNAADPRRIAGLRQQAELFRSQGKAVVLKGLCAGLFEMAQRIRGMTDAMMDLLLHPEFSDSLIGKITDLKIAFWEMALPELGDLVDVVSEADDYGTQASQLISPDQFRKSFKPHIARLIKTIKKLAPKAHVFFHSCGNVRPIIPDFIEMGIDILNPVHISAEGMEPTALKKDFGKDLTFWGGGVETQEILSRGTPAQVRDNVKQNIEALAPGGGFVFNTVHNIQAEVPPENITAMIETLQKYGQY